MKTFSVAVAVAVVLAVIYVQDSSANRDAESDEWRKPMEALQVVEDIPVTIDGEIPVASWQMPYQIRQQRRKCRFCCQCCPGMRGCGICCRF